MSEGSPLDRRIFPELERGAKVKDEPSPFAWMAPASILLGTGWGTNRITPMLLAL